MKLIYLLFPLLLFSYSIKAQNSGFSAPTFLCVNQLQGVEDYRTADLDSDGDTDILLFAGNELKWIENLGSSNFSVVQTLIHLDNTLITMEVGDLDGDGDMDIAGFLENNYTSLFVYLNDGSGFIKSTYSVENYPGGKGDIGAQIKIRSQRIFNSNGLEFWFEKDSLIGRDLNFGSIESVIDINQDGFADFIPLIDNYNRNPNVWLSETDSTFLYINLPRDQILPKSNNQVNSFEGSQAVIDVDNDGDLDVLLSEEALDPGSSSYLGYGRLGWWENLGDTTFVKLQTIDSLRVGYETIQSYDVDQDGLEDIVASFVEPEGVFPMGENPSRTYWYKNLETGVFGERQSLPLRKKIYDVSFSDLDNDGVEDLIAFNARELVWLKHGVGSEFGEERSLAESNLANVVQVKASDIDQDGLDDLLFVTYEEGMGLSWRRNNGNFTFSDPMIIDSALSNIKKVEFSDLDGDGQRDLIVLSSHYYKEYAGVDMSSWFVKYQIMWYKNNGNSFEEGQVVYNQPYSNQSDYLVDQFTVGDFDNDNDTDIVLRTSKSLVWFENNGDALFSEPLVIDDDFDAGRYVPNLTEAFDVDNDGDDEIFSMRSVYNILGEGPWAQMYYGDNLAIYDFSSDSGFFKLDEFEVGRSNTSFLKVDDFDDDSYTDILIGSSYTFYDSYSEGLTWYKSTNEDTVWRKRTLIEDVRFTNSSGIDANDVDRDGDLDFIYATQLYSYQSIDHIQLSEGGLNWIEKVNDSTFVRHTAIDSLKQGLHSVQFANVDGDEYPDLVAGIYGDNSVVLYRNQATQTGTEFEMEVTPTQISLSQNYPNPFNPTTKIGYTIPESGLVELSVYNLLGQHVQTLVNEPQTAGNYTINFNAASLASGVYIYRLNVSGVVQTRKMLLIK